MSNVESHSISLIYAKPIALCMYIWNYHRPNLIASYILSIKQLLQVYLLKKNTILCLSLVYKKIYDENANGNDVAPLLEFTKLPHRFN